MRIEEVKTETHELVAVNLNDPRCCIAIHDTRLGPALGGVRLQPTYGYSEMVEEAMALSKAMTYKNAIAGVPRGGGKAVISGCRELTVRSLENFLELLDYVNMRVGYTAAPDMGTDNITMQTLQHLDPDANVLALEEYDIDPSVITAKGVFQALLGFKSFKGLTNDDMVVNIEGVGKVGYQLAWLCKQAGWDICVTDIEEKKAMTVAESLGTAYSPLSDLRFLKGIYSPCAIPGTIDYHFAMESEASGVVGAANCQFAQPQKGTEKVLRSRNILYVPDFVANSGGVIAADCILSATEEDIDERLAYIRSQANALLMAGQKLSAWDLAIETADKILEGKNYE